jgi:ABC-type cobalamin/Fe3+-siderophores transport system ATPase subunit
MLPPDIPAEKFRNGREVIQNSDPSNFAKLVNKYGGICIAAHIDTDRGIRRAFRQLGRTGITFYAPEGKLSREEEKQISDEFKRWMLSAGFNAIEVSRETDKQHYHWIGEVEGQRVSIPALLGNDAHCPDEIAREGRINHIKMTGVNFMGLEQALRFPDTRIRFPSDVPRTPSPRLLGMQIIAGDEKGFFDNLEIAFSDNLTCMIGPRGSGKSTIVEALRYVFGYNRTLDQIESGQDLPKKIRSLQQATLSNCVIRVAYCGKNGEVDILEAAYDPKQDYVSRVYTIDGVERQVADIDASGLYPLRLFGWSELETLGREAHRQREILDRLIEGLGEKLDECKTLRLQLADKRREIESSLSTLQNILGKNKGEIRRYREYKADFDKLNTEEVKQLFADIDIARAKGLVLGKVRTNAEAWLKASNRIKDTDLLAGLDELVAEPSKKIESWWIEIKGLIKLSERQSEIRNDIRKAIAVLEDLVGDVDKDIKETNQEIQEKDQAIREKVSAEAAKQVVAELRRTAGERLQRANGLRKEYNTEWKRLNDLLMQWREIAAKLTSLHDEISGKRVKRKDEIEGALNRFSTAEMNISIRFDASRDREGFCSHLRDGGLLNRDLHGNYKANLWPERIASACTPIELAEAILDKEPSRLVKSVQSDGVELGVGEPMAKKLVTTLYPFDTDSDADVSSVDGHKLLNILTAAEVDWNDVEGILLNNRPVERLSPGQRSSAMLPLIALAENAPLVIDQPEDNLDNRLVGKMLVDILTDLKEKRQIIVATHNPNIVVSGDAEQVIVLEALSNSKGKRDRSGSIDTKEIVDAVVDIMEGGKEAFLVRQMRYSLA